MADAKFKKGDIVYHKSTLKNGVISNEIVAPVRGEIYDWEIVWKDGERGKHTEAELWTEEEYKEYKEQNPDYFAMPVKINKGI